jgi:predicted rRNA methylase YqxC with S4 and FtsJ domains
MIRLDKYLVGRYSQFSRNKINNFISLGYVLVNNKQITKSSYLIKENDEVVLVVDENNL